MLCVKLPMGGADSEWIICCPLVLLTAASNNFCCCSKNDITNVTSPTSMEYHMKSAHIGTWNPCQPSVKTMFANQAVSSLSQVRQIFVSGFRYLQHSDTVL